MCRTFGSTLQYNGSCDSFSIFWLSLSWINERECLAFTFLICFNIIASDRKLRDETLLSFYTTRLEMVAQFLLPLETVHLLWNWMLTKTQYKTNQFSMYTSYANCRAVRMEDRHTECHLFVIAWVWNVRFVYVTSVYLYFTHPILMELHSSQEFTVQNQNRNRFQLLWDISICILSNLPNWYKHTRKAYKNQ